MMDNSTCLTILCIALMADYAISCCLPDKIEGTVELFAGITARGGMVVQGSYKVSYDAVGKRIYLDGFSYINGKGTKLQLYQDLENKYQYIITGGKCIIQPLGIGINTESFKCLPIDKKVSSSYIGSESERVTIDVYQLNVANTTSITSVEPDTCTLISQQVITEHGVFHLGFLGMKSYFADEKVFDIPPTCNKSFNHRRASRGNSNVWRYLLSLHE